MPFPAGPYHSACSAASASPLARGGGGQWGRDGGRAMAQQHEALFATCRQHAVRMHLFAMCGPLPPFVSASGRSKSRVAAASLTALAREKSR